MPKKPWEEIHEVMGNSSDIWILCAKEYLLAVKILDRYSDWNGLLQGKSPLGGVQFQRPRLMLCGYVVEFFLKALCLKAKVKAVDKGKLTKDFKTHDLRALSQRASVDNKLDKRQKEILTDLRYYIEDGRYPVSVKSEKMYGPIRKANSGGGSTFYFWSLEKEKALSKLIDLLQI